MTVRPLTLAVLAVAALAPMAAAGADTALPDGLRCDTLDCRNDTDQDYIVSGYIQCEYTDAAGVGTSGSEQFADVVPAHAVTRLTECIDGQAPYLRTIDEVE